MFSNTKADENEEYFFEQYNKGMLTFNNEEDTKSIKFLPNSFEYFYNGITLKEIIEKAEHTAIFRDLKTGETMFLETKNPFGK